MPRFLSVKNLEKYQHYRDRNPPWVKLHRDHLTDYTLRNLSTHHRFVFTCALTLAAETGNCIPLDTRYLSERIGASISEGDVRTLIRSGLLLAQGRGSVASITPSDPVQPETETERERETETDFSSDSCEVRLASLLWGLIHDRNPKHKEPNLQTWAKSIDLMLRVDKRTEADIEAVIRWCQADPFWQNNILSTDKLRKQFDQLTLKKAAPQVQANKPPPFPPSTDPIARNSWRQAYGDPKAYGY